MISRTYICRMPNVSGGSVNLDIAVRNAPGSKSAPVGTGGVVASAANGAYYEWRGRQITFPTPAFLPGGAVNPASVPRARLGWRLSIYRYGGVATDIPSVLLSQSIVGSLDSTETGGPIIDPLNLLDPAYGPVIRLGNAAVFDSQIFVVHFDLEEPKDEDRDPNGT